MPDDEKKDWRSEEEPINLSSVTNKPAAKIKTDPPVKKVSSDVVYNLSNPKYGSYSLEEMNVAENISEGTKAFQGYKVSKQGETPQFYSKGSVGYGQVRKDLMHHKASTSNPLMKKMLTGAASLFSGRSKLNVDEDTTKKKGE